ncbi:serine/threonine/tyrosine-interacting protein B-like [Phymastichus coffea]|uniref:serine/threonine/tyrosine-interacting protein B-like n=1 Tax=Phymastichus coffea TaxID=108790 RepID=UPI00273BEAFA|nr:serine/threonine/tyrosine-interacting protein B-like [Phymastichus coffea]
MLSAAEDNRAFQNEETDLDSETLTEYPKISTRLDTPKEWTYVMRRSMQEIVRGLYLGPYSAASKSKLDSLLECGITHIICVRQNIEAHFIRPNFPERFQYLVLDIADSTTENIIQHFQKVKQFIDQALNSGGQVLVHGNAGISRSAALVLAYLMETYGLTQQKAYAILQQRRFCINPNDGFMAQLREYEPIYQAQRLWKNGQLPDHHGNKRGFEIDDRTEAMDSC